MRNIPTALTRTLRVAFAIAATLLLLESLPLRGLRAEDPKPPEAAAAALDRQLRGTWILVGKPGQVEEPPHVGGRLKFFTGRHWTITQADPNTGEVMFHHGGTYTLKGDELSETIGYANKSTAEL